MICHRGMPGGVAAGMMLFLAAGLLYHPGTATGSSKAQQEAAAPFAELDALDAYRLALLKIKAHLQVAQALLRQRASNVGPHLRERIPEISRGIEAQLEARKATLSADIIEQLERGLGGDALAMQSSLDTALTAVDGSLVRTGRFDPDSLLDLSGSLLRDAVVDYRRAVSGGDVVDPTGYQSGGGYVAIAAALLRRHGPGRVPAAYERASDSVTLLREAWPGVVPPSIAHDPTTVAGWLSDVEAALGELR